MWDDPIVICVLSVFNQSLLKMLHIFHCTAKMLIKRIVGATSSFRNKRIKKRHVQINTKIHYTGTKKS